MDHALFVPAEDGALLPTGYGRGPWDVRHLHGGPVGALLAGAVETIPDAGMPLEVSRITIEILKPVPLDPLVVTASVLRPGRKVQLVEATLTHAATGDTLAIARALRIRTSDVPLPHDDAELGPLLAPEPAPSSPEAGRLERGTHSIADVAFHTDGVEHRFVEGSWADAGPVVVWTRLVTDVVGGEDPSPLQRTVAAADFGNGVSRALSFDTHLFINPDLTVHLLRPAVGEWIGMRTKSHIGPSGTGMAESELFDRTGRIGRSVQSLLIDTR
jgi:hypothetical protein